MVGISTSSSLSLLFDILENRVLGGGTVSIVDPFITIGVLSRGDMGLAFVRSGVGLTTSPFTEGTNLMDDSIALSRFCLLPLDVVGMGGRL